MDLLAKTSLRPWCSSSRRYHLRSDSGSNVGRLHTRRCWFMARVEWPCARHLRRIKTFGALPRRPWFGWSHVVHLWLGWSTGRFFLRRTSWFLLGLANRLRISRYIRSHFGRFLGDSSRCGILFLLCLFLIPRHEPFFLARGFFDKRTSPQWCASKLRPRHRPACY